MNTSLPRKVKTWAEFREEWHKDHTVEERRALIADRIEGTGPADDEAKANERLAHLTGICEKCGDEGWWIDDDGIGPCNPGTFHYCDCPEGVRRQAEAKAEDEQLAAQQRP